MNHKLFIFTYTWNPQKHKNCIKINIKGIKINTHKFLDLQYKIQWYKLNKCGIPVITYDLNN